MRYSSINSPLTRRDFLQNFSTLVALGLSINPNGIKNGAKRMEKSNKENSLLIKNGTVITERGRFEGDVRVRDEKITEIGRNLQSLHDNEQFIDARSLYVLPGGIDPHVHLTPPWADDYASGSEAALAGGITTVGNMCYGSTPLRAIEGEKIRIREQAIADVILHPVLNPAPGDSVISEFPKFISAGHNSVKVFMVTENFEKGISRYLDALRTAGEHDIITLIHCEDLPLIEFATERLLKDGKDSLRYYAESRPIISEVVATQRAVALCEATGAPIYVVHVSSERALRVCEDAQRRGLPVYVETRPLYLHFTKEKFLEKDGALYVGQPPLRDMSDIGYLWEGIARGTVHTVGTDHAPWTREQKLDPSLDITNLRPGINNLQVMLSMLYSEGVVKKKITLERFIEVTSTNAAKLFGLYPRKGIIALGSDADLVLWDFHRKWIIDDSQVFSNAGFSLFSGTEVTGMPITTIRRGEIVYQDGEITGVPGSGIMVPRKKYKGFN